MCYLVTWTSIVIICLNVIFEAIKNNWEWVLLCQETKWMSLCEKPAFTSYKYVKVLALSCPTSITRSLLCPFLPVFSKYLLQCDFHATGGEGSCSAFSSNPQSTASLGIFSKLKESLMSKCWTENCSSVKSGTSRCTKWKETQILNKIQDHLGPKFNLCLLKVDSRDFHLLLRCH